MRGTLFLREIRDAVVQTVGQRGGELPIHTADDGQRAAEIRPPGGL
jgi:hypothetical protein